MWRRLHELITEFPPGRVPLLLLALSVLTGGAIALRTATEQDRPLRVWSFTYFALVEFNDTLANHPRRDEIAVRNLGTAMFDRLALAVLTQTELPNLVEVEQSRVGRYLRGRPADIPFVDLTPWIEEEGWLDRVVPARFARYAVNGRIFGIPHDLHPMVLVYRPDVLDGLGVKPEDIQTWDDFIALGQRFHQGGQDWHFAIGMQRVEAWDFLMLLWQRGGDVFDAEGNITIDSPLAIETLTFYAGLFNMDPPVARSKLSNLAEDFRALADGRFLFCAAPDWMLAAMQQDAGEILSGKVRCMPLPAWEPGGRRTSTSGGTAMLIPTGAGDPREAWELAKDLYFDEAALVKRFRRQSIVPALTTVFDHPAFHEPAPFFDGQRVGELLTELALEVPPVNGSPYMPEASKQLDIIMPEVIDGRIAPEKALQSVAQQLKAAIARDRAAIEAAAKE